MNREQLHNHIARFEWLCQQYQAALDSKRFYHENDIKRCEESLAAFNRQLTRLVAIRNGRENRKAS